MINPIPSQQAQDAALWPLVMHELRQLLRDGRFWGVAALVAVLLVTSGAFGLRHVNSMLSERAEAQQTAAAQWTGQGDKNPHAAAHYGIYVFKPVGALSFLDPGVESSLGVTVKLQAHKRSSLEGAAAQDSTAIAQFGRLSPAAIIQLIVPLLIIGLGYTAWSAERERGTLRQIMSYGVRPRRLLLGKLVGLGGALVLLLAPAVLIGALGLVLLPGETGALSASRAGAWVAVYGVYMVAYLLGAVWVSALSPSSRGALVILLGFWGVTSLIVPRLAGDLIDRTVPMPNPSAFAAQLKASMEQGLPGSGGREARVDQLLGQLLEKEGFESDGGGMMMMQGALM
ncbi:MAG: ABC transporter permease subunit, partial [Myxococcota bacterium]